MEIPLNNQSENTEIPLTAHLEELRRRILICVFAFLVFFIVAYYQSDGLIKLLIKPIHGVSPNLKLSALSVTEGFVTTLKLAAYSAFAATLPISIWQIWRFIEPGLLPEESFWFRLLFIPMVISFFIGCSFCYFFALPTALHFFLSNLGENFIPVFSYSAYMDFAILFIILMGLIFELPLLMALLDGINFLPAEWVKSHRKHAVIFAFILGAIFSPPDAFSQLLVTLPLLLLMELGIWFSILLRKFKKRTPSCEKV